MLKGIPKILSPEVLKVLCEMGHGDTIVIADGNFPGASCAKNSILLRADGHGVPELLEAIVQVFPLDTYAAVSPVGLMAKMERDADLPTPVWDEYAKIVAPHTDRGFEMIERFEFYERAKKAYAVIMTGEGALYANVLLQKGVVV